MQFLHTFVEAFCLGLSADCKTRLARPKQLHTFLREWVQRNESKKRMKRIKKKVEPSTPDSTDEDNPDKKKRREKIKGMTLQQLLDEDSELEAAPALETVVRSLVNDFVEESLRAVHEEGDTTHISESPSEDEAQN